MGEFQTKPLHELLQAFSATSAVDFFQPMAQKLEQAPQEAKEALFEEISTKHPYIAQSSAQLIDLIAPQLQGFMLIACQQALEKGHQAAMVQQQSDEDEQLNESNEALSKLTKKYAAQAKELLASEQLNVKQADQVKILKKETESDQQQQNQLKTQLGQLTSNSKESSLVEEQLQKQLDEAKEEIKEFELHVEQIDHALVKQKEHNELQSTKLKQLITQRSEESLNVDEKVKQLNSQHSDELSLLKNENNELNTNNEQKDLLISKQNKKLVQLNESILSSEKSNEEKSLVIERLQTLGETLTAGEGKFKQEQKQLTEDLQLAKQELEKTEKALIEINEANSLIKSNNKEYEEKNNLLTDSLSELEKTSQKVHADFDKLQEENKVLKEKAEQSNSKNEGRFNDLKKDLRAETKRLEICLQEAQDKIVLLEQDKNDFIEKTKLLEAQEIEYKEELSQNKIKLDEQDNELNFTKGRNSSLQSRQETEIHQARTAYETLRTENLAHIQAIEDLAAKVMEFKLKFEYAQKQLAS
jgi:hypothetical protein